MKKIFGFLIVASSTASAFAQSDVCDQQRYPGSRLVKKSPSGNCVICQDGTMPGYGYPGYYIAMNGVATYGADVPYGFSACDVTMANDPDCQ